MNSDTVATIASIIILAAAIWAAFVVLETVAKIVLELLNEGLSFGEIIRDYYPDLEMDDIRACLRYAIALVAAVDVHLALA